eukprot:5916719-Pyramimonas_sp.AAC.1
MGNSQRCCSIGPRFSIASIPAPCKWRCAGSACLASMCAWSHPSTSADLSPRAISVRSLTLERSLRA